MRDWWPLLLAALGATLLAVLATTPSPPRGLDTPAAAFSAARAMADVREISRAPHPTGSADNARVRAWLVGRLRGLGMAVRETPAAMSDKGAARLATWSGDTTRHGIVNLVATLPGGDPAAKAVVVMAHYDSVWGSPGAADDGAGVAAALEIVRAMQAAPRARPLVVVLTDGEELGLEGGRALVAADPDRGQIGVIVNLETRGGGGRAAMFETGRDNGAMMRLFAGAVQRPSATSLSVFIYEHLPNSTDFTPAKAAGLPGFNFAFIGRSGLYHSPLATADRLDQGALQDMGDQALDLVGALVAAPALPGPAPNLVFFDAFGLGLVRYAPPVGWAVVGGAVLLFALAAWRGRVRAGEIARGVAAALLLAALAAALLWAVNRVSGAGPAANYYDRLAAIPRLQVEALLLCAGALAGVATRAGPGERRAAVAVGVAVPLLILAVAAQALAPTAAFILAWPLLLAGAAAASRSTPLRAAAAAVGGGYLLGFGFFLMQAVGAPTPAVAALPLLLIAALVWPLLPPLGRRARLAAALCVVAALGIALWVRLDPLAASVATYSLKGPS